MKLSGILGLLLQMLRVTWAIPGPQEWSRPELDMTEGFMALVDDKKSEGTLLID
jgi:hypothetical protein